MSTDQPQPHLTEEERVLRDLRAAIDEIPPLQRNRVLSLAASSEETPWISCAVRLPTKADADENGEVLWEFGNGGKETAVWDWPARDGRTAEDLKLKHWMRIPRLIFHPNTPATGEINVNV